MPPNQLIQLKPDQLEAIAKHLEQTAYELREALSKVKSNSIWVNDVQHIESILGSTDSLLREVRRSLERYQIEGDASITRSGRPRRSRRRKP